MLRGFATYYVADVGARTAYGERFDPNAMAAAMTPDRARKFCWVQVAIENNPQSAVSVRINDTGPYVRGRDGAAAYPLQPDPEIIIDLTPAAFRKLAGSLELGKVRVIVEVQS